MFKKLYLLPTQLPILLFHTNSLPNSVHTYLILSSVKFVKQIIFCTDKCQDYRLFKKEKSVLIYTNKELCMFNLFTRETFLGKSLNNILKVFFCILRRYLGEGNGTPLQYSYLENPMDGGAC